MALMRTDEGGTIRVLMVEDMELEAELAAAQLHANGIRHEALRVETEAELRAALREFRPSIILSDFALPQFDGLRALAVARECAPEVPFVFVSGTIGEERAIEALRRGAVDYVLKTNLARLGPAVKRAVEEAAANTVRRRQAQQIARLTGVLRMLSGINGAVVRIRDRGSLLQEACRLAVTVGGYATAIVTLHRVKKGTRELVAWDGTDEGAAQALAAVIERRAAQERLSNRAEGGVPPELIFSESEYRGSQPPQEAAGPPAEPGTPLDRPMIALPLKVDRTVIGVLAVCSRQRGIAGEEEMRLLREVAANLSFALQYLQQGNQVRLLSYFDVLTGLAKRPLFCQRLGQYLGPASAGRQLAVAVVDVQDLSAVNDMLGRHTGDLMLQLLADRLKTRFGSTDLLGHFGGGTFALIQPSDSEHSRPDTLTGLIDALFAEPFDLEQRSVPVAARTGLAIWPGDGHDPGVLVQRAEAALRTARAGGDRWRHYSAEQHTAALARVSLERRLRVALEHRQFELHYQPKVNIRSGSIEGAEALIRWHDPEQGLVPPAQFLQVLEATGLIADVGLWVVEQAAADCRSWREAGLPPLRVAVNVSPLQLNRMGFAEQFLERA
ncbi:MAG TPA: EAL domain-containing protein, partial [Steroidobacteraceae bacterium]|nr:EAL domain-containing protein [Steroidobacteraceae bacterium]